MDLIVNADTLIVGNGDPVITNANILQKMAESNHYCQEVVDALYMAVDYLMDSHYKKMRLGDDLLKSVLRDYELDKEGNVVKKKAEEK